MSKREYHINWLCKLKSNLKIFIPKNFHLAEFEESLEYAIASLKTDLKYDLMYEGEDIYTKADMVATLKELQTEISKLSTPPAYQDDDYFFIGVCKCDDIIQQKIDALTKKGK